MGQRLPAGSDMYWWPRSSVSAAGNANQTPRHRVPPISTSVVPLSSQASAPLPHCVFPRRSHARLCYKWRECSVRLNEVCTLRQCTCIVNYQRMWTTRDHFTYPLQRERKVGTASSVVQTTNV